MGVRARTTVRTTEVGSLGSVLEFIRLLWELDHELQSASKRMEADHGITGPQRMTIRILGRHPGLSAGELAEILHLHPSTLTGILGRLESRELIERQTDPRDGRRARFVLRPKGVQADRLRTGTIEAAIRRVLTEVPEERLAATRQTLHDIAEGLRRAT
jgi:DNA-binding MarR family transcriptional regulator